MIHIEGNYYLDADTYQFIVCEKKERKSGKDKGEEFYEQIAFCGNVKDVVILILNQEQYVIDVKLQSNLNLWNK